MLKVIIINITLCISSISSPFSQETFLPQKWTKNDIFSICTKLGEVSLFLCIAHVNRANTSLTKHLERDKYGGGNKYALCKIEGTWPTKVSSCQKYLMEDNEFFMVIALDIKI